MADSRSQSGLFADERVGIRRQVWTVRGGERNGIGGGWTSLGTAGIWDGLARSERAKRFVVSRRMRWGLVCRFEEGAAATQRRARSPHYCAADLKGGWEWLRIRFSCLRDWSAFARAELGRRRRRMSAASDSDSSAEVVSDGA